MVDSMDIFFLLGFPGIALIIPYLTVMHCYYEQYDNSITPLIIIMYFCYIIWNFIWFACMKESDNKKAIYFVLRVSSKGYYVLLTIMCIFMFGQVGWWVLLQLINIPLYMIAIGSLLPKTNNKDKTENEQKLEE